MAAPKINGNCYLCGKSLGKTAMKNHLLKEHASGGEACVLLKIEGACDKQYWLYVDAPKDKTLGAVDAFLRKIWLECCGHMSVFYGEQSQELPKARNLGAFETGDRITHEYDMGSTTECLITFAGETSRPKQKSLVRLLARNAAPVFPCASCGAPAAYICRECMYDSESPHYCEACAEEHDHKEALVTITNSPRSGECGYTGRLDVFAYTPGIDCANAGKRERL
ncbi:MAG: hypothetical protein LBD37_09400 [Treponema sp.]|jgi:hypothetical protein|nr:hypothetical protein [Treponema sp.]